ncbi:MAG: acetyl-CoA carboxylase biotin carboxyl carrier protein subunit [Bacteroidales bacterium]|jgi:biotin carboxyl carrier protein|nr:acetyl-CoA carboxylase biotin carboxyl carrier protein subunit [Bacteroidales bacterium]
MTKIDKTQLGSIIVDDSIYNTELTEKYKNRKKWVAPDNRKITGFLPGTIKEVMVKKGDYVKAEQTVVKFEAMKMINNVQSSVDGTVKKVYVSPGDKFPKGFVLVELE